MLLAQTLQAAHLRRVHGHVVHEIPLHFAAVVFFRGRPGVPNDARRRGTQGALRPRCARSHPCPRCARVPGPVDRYSARCLCSHSPPLFPRAALVRRDQNLCRPHRLHSSRPCIMVLSRGDHQSESRQQDGSHSRHRSLAAEGHRHGRWDCDDRARGSVYCDRR